MVVIQQILLIRVHLNMVQVLRKLYQELFQDRVQLYQVVAVLLHYQAQILTQEQQQ